MPPLGNKHYETAPIQIPEIEQVKFNTTMLMQGVMSSVLATEADVRGPLRMSLRPRKLESPRVRYQAADSGAGMEVCAWLEQDPKANTIKLFTATMRQPAHGQRHEIPVAGTLRAEGFNRSLSEIWYNYSQPIPEGEALTPQAELEYAQDVYATVDLIAAKLQTPTPL